MVVAVHRDRIASVWELQFGALWVAPLACLTALPMALFAFLLLEATHRDGPALRLASALVMGCAAAATAWFVAAGRHFDGGGKRVAFAALVGCVAALLVWGGRGALGRLARRPVLAVPVVLAFAVAAEIVNRFALVRLYPAFHAALAAMTLVGAGVAGGVALSSTGGRARFGAMVTAAIVLSCGALAPTATKRLAAFDNFRLLLVEHAPILRWPVEIGARLVPPRPIPGSEICIVGVDPTCTERDPSRAVDWTRRDIVLVTIDALRADHVSSYGYSRATTPSLDALAAQGVVFENAYTATPHTSYALTSIMTGKYVRPLLRRGIGAASNTWARLLRGYGYSTAAFYPPAVFFIDRSLFEPFIASRLDFEWVKEEFLEGDARAAQVEAWLQSTPRGRPVFVWLHLFGPHEPYVAHPEHAFGDRDIDRYDSEIAAADATVGRVVASVRARSADAVIIVSADHGEEFGEHGGRYHGTTVYDEQVRVPLIVSAPGLAPRRIASPAQTIDLLPTVLGALGVPRPPRIRGRDLGKVLVEGDPSPGFAFVETDDHALLAEGSLRLICHQRLGACQLFDTNADPGQLRDASGDHAVAFGALRQRLRTIAESHGVYEERGRRSEGRAWPVALVRAMSGDADAAEAVATLLDDADVEVRRKAAELLFELRREATSPALRLALGRDEDPTVRTWCALALTRLGQGAPLTVELLRSEDAAIRRLAALALAESGDRKGEGILIAWWKDEAARDHARSREILAAFARLRSRDAVWPLVQSLGDVRLRADIGRTLATIGDDAAKVPLVKAFSTERYQSARGPLLEALLDLGAAEEIAPALTRFAGVPDPLPGALSAALRAGILDRIGGPTAGALARLRTHGSVGAAVTVVVPRGGTGAGARWLVRARSSDGQGGKVWLGARLDRVVYDRHGEPRPKREVPQIDPERSAVIDVPGTARDWVEVWTTVPEALGARPGRPLHAVLFVDRHTEVAAFAVVPLATELPPPPPEPWSPGR